MRATLDKLISWMGILLAIVLLIAGGLLTWANTFIGDQVDQQFSDQDITMPTEEAIEGDPSLSDEGRETLKEFAGEPLNDGPSARAYADYYIKAHMEAGSADVVEQVEALGVDTSEWQLPMTYSSAGAAERAIMADESLSDEAKAEAVEVVNTHRSESLFKGNTLRGLLLYGYAFATVGTIAGYAAIAAYVGAVVLLILGLLGFAHSRKAASEKL